MKILGIDTTTKFLALGIYDDAKVREYNLETGVKLSLLLAVTIKRTLDALAWQAADIDYFACGLGPGSFTGIRIGLSTIKGLSFSLNKPIAGISTLDILARNVRAGNGFIVPVIDAKRNLIYCSIYKAADGILKRIAPYMLLTIDELLGRVKPNSIIFGDAVGLYKDKFFKNIKGADILDKDYWYPKPRNIIALALEKIKEKKIAAPFGIKPIYLYPKECQIKAV